MKEIMKIIELPELELSFQNILHICIGFLKTNETMKFRASLEEHWLEPLQKVFWQSYEKMGLIINNSHLESDERKGYTFYNPFEVVHTYSILLFFFKEYGFNDFDEYLHTKWKSAFRGCFWEIYFYLISLAYDSHNLLFKKPNVENLTRFHHNVILLVIIDYIMTGGNLENNAHQDEQFMKYFLLHVDRKTRNRFNETYVNLKAYIVKYFSRFTDLTDQEDIDMDFINKM